MPSQTKQMLLLLSVLGSGSGVFASPMPQTGPETSLQDCGDTYKVINQTVVEGKSTTGTQACVGGEGCNLSFQSGYSVGTTVTIGASLNLDFDDIIKQLSPLSASVDGSVSKTTTKTTVQSSSEQCPPGPWTCALKLTPQVVDIKGTIAHANAVGVGACGDPEDPKPYELQMPITGDDGTAKVTAEICVCKDKTHWADKGAPTTPCPDPCP